MKKSLKVLMLITDIGFLLYWMITFLGLLPKEMLYKDYTNEIAVAWNMSFIPLDILISVTGLTSILLYRRGERLWAPFCIVSLSLTFCSGLQAIAFWAIRGDFDIGWWIPNLFLLLYPLFYLPGLMKSEKPSLF
ncbi:hypothetical protein EHV15_10950 [Paenibacillus oralis]|uniref:YvaD family protein n=1 Tax=Paenibacillus oralis TaxID=2490856 RepID=A0A3P3TZV8_9BACL|nr:DUF5360 family protein [Paenibacillus oralis]RRJ63380.1 hypothetical protein EHV15_10950 [Paenibacillus oralis]